MRRSAGSYSDVKCGIDSKYLKTTDIYFIFVTTCIKIPVNQPDLAESMDIEREAIDLYSSLNF